MIIPSTRGLRRLGFWTRLLLLVVALFTFIFSSTGLDVTFWYGSAPVMVIVVSMIAERLLRRKLSPVKVRRLRRTTILVSLIMIIINFVDFFHVWFHKERITGFICCAVGLFALVIYSRLWYLTRNPGK